VTSPRQPGIPHKHSARSKSLRFQGCSRTIDDNVPSPRRYEVPALLSSTARGPRKQRPLLPPLWQLSSIDSFVELARLWVRRPSYRERAMRFPVNENSGVVVSHHVAGKSGS
jgi:hypothetical protein